VERCKTCRHWQHFKEYGHNDQYCASPKIRFVTNDLRPPDYKQHVLIVEETGLPLADDMAGVMDGEGYAATFAPGPDFGCIHHEPKGS
jgi:hypothetical protein